MKNYRHIIYVVSAFCGSPKLGCKNYKASRKNDVRHNLNEMPWNLNYVRPNFWGKTYTENQMLTEEQKRAFPAALFRMACMLLALVGVASCSTVSNIPDDEQLYTGIKSIDYNGVKKTTKLDNDSAGVIKSIADAARTVDDLLNAKGGVGVKDLLDLTNSSDTLSEKERRAAEKAQRAADAKAWETAQEEVDGVLAYPPNASLFGSSSLRHPLPMGLWFYNGFVNSKNAVGKWIFKNFSQKPKYISMVNPELRSRVATNTLHNYGYFHGKVDYEILPYDNKRKAKVKYYVTPRDVFRFDSISYLGYPAAADTLIRSKREWPKRLLHRGDQFSAAKISEEKTRIRDLFRNNGYYYFNSDYTVFSADTFAVPGKVQLRIQPAKDIPEKAKHKWYYGRKYIYINTYPGDTAVKHVTRNDFEFFYPGRRIPLHSGVWKHNVFSMQGKPYSYREQSFTTSKLSSLQVFSSIDMNYVPRDSTDNCDTLDVYLFAQLDKPYETEFNMNVTAKSNDLVGPGASFEIAKRNAFRAGERLSFRVYGSYEWETQNSRSKSNDLLNSYELGNSLSVEFPTLFMPWVDNSKMFFPSSTKFTLSGDWLNRSGYFNMAKWGLDMTYNWRPSRHVTHALSIFSLDYNRIFKKSAKFDSVMNANPALFVSMRNQFIPAVSYSFTYSSTRNAVNPIWWQTTIKESGNLVSGIYALSGRKFNEQNKSLMGNPFAQFLKLTTEVHKTFTINPTFKFATRFFAGVIYSYGNSTVAPYSEQFSSGGANSIRAFTVRSIGPGRFHSGESKYSYIDQTGDIKLEANAELRFKLFGSLYGAAFLDAGNIWLMRKDEKRPEGRLNGSDFLKSLALGTGAGLRYDMEFLVLRLDLGVALHAPYETSRKGYYNIEKFADGLSLNFAIGYPF